MIEEVCHIELIGESKEGDGLDKDGIAFQTQLSALEKERSFTFMNLFFEKGLHEIGSG